MFWFSIPPYLPIANSLKYQKAEKCFLQVSRSGDPNVGDWLKSFSLQDSFPLRRDHLTLSRVHHEEDLLYTPEKVPLLNNFQNHVPYLILQFNITYRTEWTVDPGGPVVIILASGSEVRRFDPGRGRWILFQSVEILSMTSFGREVKPWVLCRRFTARKRTSSWNWSLWAKFVGLFTFYVGSDADHLRC